MTTFQKWYRFQYGEGESIVTVDTDAAQVIRTSQALAGSVTTVAEVALAEVPDGIETATVARIHQLDIGQAGTELGAPTRQQFIGQVNIIDADSSPQGCRLTCTGRLARLRRSPLTNHDLTGFTDVEAASYILDICNVPFDEADISGWGYELGQRAPVLWTAGQTGADMLSELDRVFNCSTLEMSSGRVIRFPYHLSPYQYTDPDYAATYRKGATGVAFYGNHRTRGDMDRIFNRWEVTGLSWSGEEDTADEGNRYQIYAVAYNENEKLGTSVYVPGTFQSDLIQTEDLAKAIAIRLMEENNREPDTERIEAGNNLNVCCGSLLLVKDGTPGIDLDQDRRYLVTNITREWDYMSLDVIGGATGEVGTVVSGIWKETPEGRTDTGTDGPAFTPPDPAFPGGEFPDYEIPDFPGGGGITEPPDPSQPFINCTTEGSGFEPGDVPPPEGAVDYYIPWYGADTWIKHPSGESWSEYPLITLIDSISSEGSVGTLLYSPTGDSGDVVEFGTNEVITLSGCFIFHFPASSFNITLRNGVNYMGVFFYSSPGWNVGHFTDAWSEGSHPETNYGIRCHTENSGAGLPGFPASSPSGNNGGLAGSPFPVGSEITFSVSFNPSIEYQEITVGSSAGGTFMKDLEVQLGSTLHYPDCTHPYHSLGVGYSVNTSTDEWADSDHDDDHPAMTICGLSLGLGTCETNPDFSPPDQDPGEPV